MQLRPDQLAAHLERGCRPLYTLHGDDPLLLQEAAKNGREIIASGAEVITQSTEPEPLRSTRTVVVSLPARRTRVVPRWRSPWKAWSSRAASAGSSTGCGPNAS